MAQAPIRWAVLGAGAIAAEFIKGLKALPDAEIHAVGSRTLEKAQAFAGAHGVREAYGSYEACVADPKVDIVYIATPNHRHFEDAALCLRAGKAVLCEKPFTQNAAEAEALVELARSRGVFCMEGMWTRFTPLVQELRARLRAGAVGRPVLLTAEFGLPTRFDPASRFFDPALGGGALLDRGVYLVSLAFFLFGAPDRVVSAAASAPTGVDESSSVILSWDGGPMAVLSSSLAARYANTATLYGDQGRLILKDPLYAPEEMVFIEGGAPIVAGAAATAGGTGLKGRVVGGIKGLPYATVLARRLRALKSSTTTIRSHGASAYRFEAAEAMRCLRLGLTESPDMSLEESLRILRCLDEIRNAFAVSQEPSPV